MINEMHASKNPRKKSASRKKSPPWGSAGGDCYEAAATFITGYGIESKYDGNRENLILVHAEVAGQGHLNGITYGHAFVVDTSTDTVIDKSNGRDLRLPRIIYYAIGQIADIGNYHEYTRKEAAANLLKYKHYGPWDLKTSSGL